MATLRIRLFGDPILRQEAREVTDFDGRLQTLAGDMLETMRAAPGVGLAAPQVGVLKRLFVWQSARDEEDDDQQESGAVVNPVLLDASEETFLGEEGCLSFPGLFYDVERPLRAQVAYHDLAGGERTRRLEGFLARVWLHEMDHLNGILFIDHLAAHDRREAMRRMRRYRLEREGEPSGNLLLERARGG